MSVIILKEAIWPRCKAGTCIPIEEGSIKTDLEKTGSVISHANDTRRKIMIIGHMKKCTRGLWEWNLPGTSGMKCCRVIDEGDWARLMAH